MSSFGKLLVKFHKLMIPFYKMLDKILPKNGKKVVFTSYPDFSDSAYDFYKFLIQCKQNKFKNILWIKQLKKADSSNICHKQYYMYTFKGIWHILTAKYFIHDHCSAFIDVLSSDRHVLFNLWHGMPIKAIGNLDDGLFENTKRRYYYVSKNSYMFVTSDIYKMIMSALLEINPNKIFVTGQARTDSIFHSREQEIKDKLEIGGFKHIVLYMPTYKARGTGNDVDTAYDNIFYLDKYTDSDFLNFLESNEILFIIKPHPFEAKILKDKIKSTALGNHPNVRLFDNDNLIKKGVMLNELFSLSDLMVSDFSSVTIDYIMLNKPVLYLSNYLEQYKQGRGFILPDNYKVMMPGENVCSYEDLKTKIIECSDNKKANYTEHEVSLLHKYLDGNSCERIFDVMKEL